MAKDKVINKVIYSEYDGKYDERIVERLVASPRDIEVEEMREFLYGYTFTENYAKGEFPDEMSMDYWRDDYDMAEENLNLNFDDDFFAKADIEDFLNDESVSDDYFVDTIQERRFLEAIDSTGDGKSPVTALCVTDVGMEYEYIRRVFPYCTLKVEKQSVSGEGIDCLEFEENDFGVERIYFDMARRFEVGYPMNIE